MTGQARRARRERDERPASGAFAAAATAYAANCALGAAVAAQLIDTRRFRWVHHALYILTCATTGLAVVAGLATRMPRSHRAALALLPAAVPLAAIPYAGTHTRRHPLVALTAAPFVLAGLVVSRLPSDRK
ncbi:hypothetical protein [Microbacterium paraoxydans]|uniref:hypothetical protein n=1 Tax=Microbacterium paraoxydans TaxID=199592 RepID=UPI0011A67EB9|nr:hypothetical protein [Microbacterium paraoxydans]